MKQMSKWKPQVGRISLFPTAPSSSPPIHALDLYRRVWKVDPDGFQKQGNPLQPTFAHGKRGGLAIRFVTQPTRIDLELGPLQPSSEEKAQESLPLIEDASQLHAELLKIIDAVREQALGSVVRVALNIQFLAQESNITTANRALTATIPDAYRIKITDEQDFILQFNRPRMSDACAGIMVNYIPKWSVDRIQLVTFSMPVGGVPTPAQLSASATPASEFIAANVTLDINNVPTARPLSGDQQAGLLSEALTAAAQMQRDFGLNVEGFQSVKVS